MIECKRCGQLTEWPKGKKKDHCPPCFVKSFLETFCVHSQGRWAGSSLVLLDWQDELITKAFGTLKPDGKRQYRTIYVEIPKKNGKTFLAAGLALYGLVGDDESGPEVYSAAGDIKQAALVYRPAAKMVAAHPKLSSRLKVIDSTKRIVDYGTGGFYQVLSADVFTKHGINPSLVIFDELHAQPNRELWDVLTEGTDVAREQQLIFVITTAGVEDKTSIGWEIHEYARQVKEGIIEDTSFLPMIFAANPEDDWQDPNVWSKANPSMGKIFEIENIRKHCDEVKNNPARLNNFLRYRLNLWVGQVSRYIPMDKWDACDDEVDPGALLKRTCYGGLDLSSNTDLTAFVLAFPPDEDDSKWRVIAKFFMPEEGVLERSRKDKVPYDMWARAGLIKLTPGNVVDYAFIRKEVVNAAELYDLREVAYDPWGAIKLALELQEEDGITMVEHRQGFKSISNPTKELLGLILNGSLAHGGNPVLRWNADGLAVKIDASENVRPVKDQSAHRIDGIIGLIMAIGRASVHVSKKSVYEDRGIVVL